MSDYLKCVLAREEVPPGPTLTVRLFGVDTDKLIGHSGTQSAFPIAHQGNLCAELGEYYLAMPGQGLSHDHYTVTPIANVLPNDYADELKRLLLTYEMIFVGPVAGFVGYGQDSYTAAARATDCVSVMHVIRPGDTKVQPGSKVYVQMPHPDMKCSPLNNESGGDSNDARIPFLLTTEKPASTHEDALRLMNLVYRQEDLSMLSETLRNVHAYFKGALAEKILYKTEQRHADWSDKYFLWGFNEVGKFRLPASATLPPDLKAELDRDYKDDFVPSQANLEHKKDAIKQHLREVVEAGKQAKRYLAERRKPVGTIVEVVKTAKMSTAVVSFRQIV